MRVLLVEDTEDLRHLFARMLKAHGLEVSEAANGREALNTLATFSPDLIITDLMMPMMDGIELIRQVRLQPTLDSIPVVVITADDSTKTEREAREAGAIDFIVKPIDIPSLLDRLFGLGR